MEAPPFASSTKTLPFRSASPSSLLFLPKTRLNFRRPTNFSVRASAAADSVRLNNETAVTLLDYGAGNVRSVRNAIRHLGFDVKDVQTPEDILNAERLVFPGVGAFAAAMDVLNKNGMAEAICSYMEKDRPFLGICLGLQLLFESSEENGSVKGLGLIPGVVGHFDSSNGFRVPHIGWNALQIEKDSLILDDVGSHHVYFVHSYRAMQSDENKDWVSSTCNYGDNFIASIRRGNVHAVQFHPEKSGGKISFLSPVSGGREGQPIGAYELAKAVEELGAGEILLNCIDCDGQKKGFDIDLIKLISNAVNIPVIASSGAGSAEHFSEVFRKTNASAALAAGIFHRKEVPIQSVKEHLLNERIEVRICTRRCRKM
ncbi:hypothetical protein ACFX13_007418 [Malus domestica]